MYSFMCDLQPEFGMACKTPPENKKPVALLDDTAMNRTAGVGNEEGQYNTLITVQS